MLNPIPLFRSSQRENGHTRIMKVSYNCIQVHYLQCYLDKLSVITNLLTICCAADMKKAVSKCSAKTHSFQVGIDEPWDTMKAQILAKITITLNPSILNLADYTFMCMIPHVIPKPRLPLGTDDDYAILLEHVSKASAKAASIVSVTAI